MIPELQIEHHENATEIACNQSRLDPGAVFLLQCRAPKGGWVNAFKDGQPVVLVRENMRRRILFSFISDTVKWRVKKV